MLLRTGFLGSFDNTTARALVLQRIIADGYMPRKRLLGIRDPPYPRAQPRPWDYNKILTGRDVRGEFVLRSRTDSSAGVTPDFDTILVVPVIMEIGMTWNLYRSVRKLALE